MRGSDRRVFCQPIGKLPTGWRGYAPAMTPPIRFSGTLALLLLTSLSRAHAASELSKRLQRIMDRPEHTGYRGALQKSCRVYTRPSNPILVDSGTAGDRYLTPVTSSAVTELGCENIVDAMSSPLPGSNPETDLAMLRRN